MNVLTHDITNQNTKINIPNKVRAEDLIKLFDSIAPHINVLSLDCFDTLLWRKTLYPKDVFYKLQQDKKLQDLGITAMQRIGAEDNVRRLHSTLQGTSEVTLNEIYAKGFRTLTAEEAVALADAEVNAEIDSCYAYFPMLQLIRHAHAQKKKIIIVSNTYLVEAQLRQLLKNTLPEDVYTMLSQVFCSSDYRCSKGNGLFSHVLANLKLPANTILHLGDNESLDCIVPRAQGLYATHFLQFDKNVIEWMRLHSLAATLTDPDLHYKKPLYSIYRGLFSTANKPIETPEAIIGYFSAGPIMYAFAQYLHDEIDKLKKAGKRPNVLFLMRDAYLLSQAYEAFYGEAIGQCVRISRFSATAASFKTVEDIVRHLSNNGFVSRFQEACEQFQLSDELTQKIINESLASPSPVSTFNKLICRPEISRIILSASEMCRRKLIKYLQKTANIQAGETVVLVDIGYIGRTQNVITPVLIEDMQAQEVVGRYLISLNIPEWQKTRAGLIDPSGCDDRVMNMLTSNMYLFEEVCNSCDNSVKSYTEDGDPVFSQTYVETSQHQRIRAIQAECLRFIRDAKIFFNNNKINPSPAMLRDIALYELVRREYFPFENEIKYLENFKHDINTGSLSGCVSLSTVEKEYQNLRRQGLCFTDQHSYGLRSANIGLSMMQLSQRRFGFELNVEDVSFNKENINVMLVINQQSMNRMISAVPTHDGYYAMWFPLVKGSMQIAILFGMHYRYIQLETAELIDKKYFYQIHENMFTENILDKLMINQLDHKGENLFECLDKSSSVIFSSFITPDEPKDYILRVVFRPVIR